MIYLVVNVPTASAQSGQTENGAASIALRERGEFGAKSIKARLNTALIAGDAVAISKSHHQLAIGVIAPRLARFKQRENSEKFGRAENIQSAARLTNPLARSKILR